MQKKEVVSSMEIYTEHEVQKLHEEYWSYHKEEGYLFAGAMDIYVPMLALQIVFSYIGSMPLTITEKFFCRLVLEGIFRMEDIAFVLGLDENIVFKVAAELEKSGIIYIETDELSQSKICGFTQTGKQLYQKEEKIAVEKKQMTVFFNTVSQNIENGSCECYEQKMPNEYFKIEPFFIPQNEEEQTQKLLVPQLQVMFPDKSRLEEFIIGKKEVYYKRYHMMLYCMEDKPSICFELYDRNKKCFDTSAKIALQKKFSQGKLPRMTEIFCKAQEGNYYLTDFEKQFGMKPVKIQYLMNREIRELVKNIFKLAQNSLLIVSPWISNDEAYVMSEEFIQQMEMALKEKKLTFTLAYGYKNQEFVNKLTDKYLAGEIVFRDKCYQDNQREIQTELAARNLKERFSKYPNFQTLFRHTHEKVLCYDEKVSLVGSFNYFSYDGGEKSNYEGIHFRKEGAVLIEDEFFAKSLLEKIQNEEL